MTRSIHVLLVEDEEAHAELIQLSFETRPEVRLSVASSLREARAHLAESTPDLAIIDSLLPDGTGVDLIRELRQASSCPIALLTSHADEAMQQHALAAGASRYVVKSDVTLLDMPQITDSLLARVGDDVSL